MRLQFNFKSGGTLLIKIEIPKVCLGDYILTAFQKKEIFSLKQTKQHYVIDMREVSYWVIDYEN